MASKKSTKTKTARIVHVPVSCPSCGSTERTHYQNVVTRAIDGIHDGFIYNQVVWRRCMCRECGQRMTVKSFENSGGNRHNG